jgi:hypothetical protein
MIFRTVLRACFEAFWSPDVQLTVIGGSPSHLIFQ